MIVSVWKKKIKKAFKRHSVEDVLFMELHTPLLASNFRTMVPEVPKQPKNSNEGQCVFFFQILYNE